MSKNQTRVDTTKITIRELEKEDLPHVKAIFREFVRYHENWDAIFQKIEAAEEAWGDYILESHTKVEDSRALVAELNGKIVGYCVGHVTEKPPIYAEKLIGEVENIAVKAGYKRRGIGERLFRAMKDWFVERGVCHVELEAATANPQSMGFWGKMGGREFTKRMVIEIE
jgi:ribosomal protein S18 acetylase RimI-like enzyme